MTFQVTLKPFITIDHNADDWQLFYPDSPESNDVAKLMNEIVTKAISSSNSALSAYRKIQKEYSNHSIIGETGGCDSEPNWELDNILDKAFPLDNWR